MMDDIDDIRTWLKLSPEQDASDLLIESVRNEISTLLLEKIFFESPCSLLQLGRKAAHLINDHELRMKEQDLDNSLFLRLGSGVFQIRPDYTKGSKIIVFADSINTGREVDFLLSYFKSVEDDISKIFCYLKNDVGVRYLDEKSLISDEDIIGVFTTKTQKEYKDHFRSLQAFFRSRIEPMDPDLCFNTYSVNTLIDYEDLDRFFRPILSKKFPDKIIQKDTDLTGLASNIQEINYAQVKIEHCKKICMEAFKEPVTFDLDIILFSFKINRRRVSSDFAVWIQPMIHVSDNVCESPEKLLKDPEKCFFKIYTVDLEEERAKKILCPACIHFCISEYLLERLNEVIGTMFKESGLVITLKSKGRPIPIKRDLI